MKAAFGLWEEAGGSEKTHTRTRRTGKLHTGRTQLGIEPGLSCSEARALTAGLALESSYPNGQVPIGLVSLNESLEFSADYEKES